MSKEKILVTKKATNEINYEEYAQVKYAICGNTLVVKGVQRKNNSASVKRLNKKEYLVPSTGEIRSFNHKEDKGELNLYKYKDRFDYLKLLIRKNFEGKQNERFLTMTYDCSKTDIKKVATDFKAFWRKFEKKYPHCEYIRIIEPHKNGAWHLHILVKDTVNKKLTFKRGELNKLWGLGYVKASRIYDSYGLSIYFFPSFDVNGKGKPKEKFKRLRFYPVGVNIYSKSKGIEEIEYLIASEKKLLADKLKEFNCPFSTTYEINQKDNNGNKKFINKTFKQEFRVNKSLKISDLAPELSGEGKEVCEDEDL